MWAFGCHDNHIFDPIYPKTQCNRSTTPLMLHKKFDQNWQTGLIHVRKCKYIYGIFSALSGTYLQSDWSDQTGILNVSRFHAGNQQVWRRSDTKWTLNIWHRKYKWTVNLFSTIMFRKNKMSCQVSLVVQYIIRVRFIWTFNRDRTKSKIWPTDLSFTPTVSQPCIVLTCHFWHLVRC